MYIVTICDNSPFDPRVCKYDMCKVREGRTVPGSEAPKDALDRANDNMNVVGSASFCLTGLTGITTTSAPTS